MIKDIPFSLQKSDSNDDLGVLKVETKIKDINALKSKNISYKTLLPSGMLSFIKKFVPSRQHNLWMSLKDFNEETIPQDLVVIGGECFYATFESDIRLPSEFVEIEQRKIKRLKESRTLRVFLQKKVIDVYAINPNWVPALQLDYFIEKAKHGIFRNSIIISGSMTDSGGLVQAFIFEQGSFVSLSERRFFTSVNSVGFSSEVETLVSSLQTEYPTLDVFYAYPFVESDVFSRFARYIDESYLRKHFVRFVNLNQEKKKHKDLFFNAISAFVVLSSLAIYFSMPLYFSSKMSDLHQKYISLSGEIEQKDFTAQSMKQLQSQRLFLQNESKNDGKDWHKASVLINQIAQGMPNIIIREYSYKDANKISIKIITPKQLPTAVVQADELLQRISDITGWKSQLLENGYRKVNVIGRDYWEFDIISEKVTKDQKHD